MVRKSYVTGSAWLAALVLMSGGCGPPAAVILPELQRVVDLDSDPRIIAFDLKAGPARKEYRAGKPSDVWAYNGSVPGPLVEATVGDELRVHFTNELSEPTTIHWHGLRVPADMDGTHAPIAPGGSFDYRFTLKDPGLYWFHPHVRTDVQVEKGLYGLIVVRDPEEPASLGRERVLALDDVLLGSDGALGGHGGMDGMSSMTGLQGNVLLVNGAEKPTLQVAPGERLRLRLVNVANARYFRLGLGGRPLLLVGGDRGLLSAPRTISELLLAPGERADLLIDVEGESGETLQLMNEPYERGHSTGGGEAHPLLTLRIEGARVVAGALPAFGTAVAAIEAPVRSRALKLTEEVDAMSGMEASFKINGESYPNVTPLAARVGDIEEWTVVNDTEMDHPFHLHGFFFQVIRRGDRAEPFLEWKDTINVAARSSLTFRVAFDERPGKWLYHCHILEHAEGGMVGELTLSP